LINQIRIISDISKSLVQRIGRGEATPLEDSEVTFEDLYARIDKTVEILQAAKRENFQGPEEAAILGVGPASAKKYYKLTSLEFVQKCRLHFLPVIFTPSFAQSLMRFGTHRESSELFLPQDYCVQHLEKCRRAFGEVGLSGRSLFLRE
jgi:hypothetical protein